MTTQAPAGYKLPKLAEELIAHAAAHGWLTAVNWVCGPDVEEPFVQVHVARQLVPGETPPVDATDPYAPVRTDNWHYRITWHSRGCGPGKLKLSRSPVATTPWHPQWNDGPSVKGIREVIARHPHPSRV